MTSVSSTGGSSFKSFEEIIWQCLFDTHDDFPGELKEGKKFVANIKVNHLSDLLTKKGYEGRAKLCGQFVDATGNVYRSRWHTYRIRIWVFGSWL